MKVVLDTNVVASGLFFSGPPSTILEEVLRPICSDPDDDKFFACAVAGKAKLIVSGDRHLLDVS